MVRNIPKNKPDESATNDRNDKIPKNQVGLLVLVRVSTKKGLMAIPKWKLGEDEDVHAYGEKLESFPMRIDQRL